MSRTANTTNKTSKTANSSKSVSSKKVYTIEEMKEMEEKLAEAWKVYGRDKEVGRDMYKLYGRGHKPKVDVPVPRTEPWDYRQAAMKEKKPCPQMTKIEYPKVITKQDILRQKLMDKVTKLDTIPKRKNYNEIMADLEILKNERKAYVPANKGVDRRNMIHNLQDKFKYAGKNNGPELTTEEELKIHQAVEAQMRRVAKKNYFGTHGIINEHPPGQEPKVPSQGKYESQELNDLNELFDEVIGEIEERQQYLAEVDRLEMNDTKEKVKQEIVNRVAELQKINKMIKDEKARIAGLKEENGGILPPQPIANRPTGKGLPPLGR
jgi:hypothetical protein